MLYPLSKIALSWHLCSAKILITDSGHHSKNRGEKLTSSVVFCHSLGWEVVGVEAGLLAISWAGRSHNSGPGAVQGTPVAGKLWIQPPGPACWLPCTKSESQILSETGKDLPVLVLQCLCVCVWEQYPGPHPTYLLPHLEMCSGLALTCLSLFHDKDDIGDTCIAWILFTFIAE